MHQNYMEYHCKFNIKSCMASSRHHFALFVTCTELQVCLWSVALQQNTTSLKVTKFDNPETYC